jgi:hypothetical protein
VERWFRDLTQKTAFTLLKIANSSIDGFLVI